MCDLLRDYGWCMFCDVLCCEPVRGARIDCDD